ncbi:MAG: DUF5682 family protein [Planctomycetota bacterium]
MHERVHTFGIRHHGPGSARSLLAALEELDPAAVLVEAPIDVQEALPFANASGMEPPVALLVHDKKDPSRALFHPFAEYSPEWQAMRWALRKQRPLWAIDLAAGVELRDDKEHARAPNNMMARDPLTALAEAAGHSDGEAWWNAIVEQQHQSRGVFAAITAAMTAVRAQSGVDAPLDDADDQHDGASEADEDRAAQRHARKRELQREAQMRERIRKALDEFDGSIAVVVGAWHAPAIEAKHTRTADRALLKGVRPAPVEVTWVPWTDTRLAAASGYAAGVLSPGWYRHLWRCFTQGGQGSHSGIGIGIGSGINGGIQSAVLWQTDTTRLLRSEGLPAATASTIEAARLATCLAALRGHPVPGLAEMQDASLAALCHGDTAPLQVIAKRLVIGERIGAVAESVPQMALLADLSRWQKKLRLKPEASKREIAVDLRTDAGLAKSTLLHRLLMIDVPWGKLLDAAAGRGTFRELWQIEWQPELSVQLAEALRWGTTVASAAQQAAIDKADRAKRIVDIASIVERCLLADLEEAATATIAKLQASAARSSDIGALMAAATPLAAVLRYGTARKLPTDALLALLDSIATEVVTSLGYSCRSLDADAAAALQAQLSAFDRALDALGTLEAARGELHRERWHKTLASVADDSQTNPRIAGWAVRCRHDHSASTPDDTARSMSRALSSSVPTQQAGEWLGGFVGEAAQVLMHDERLLALVDTWLQGPEEEDFVELLPVLRREFSDFDAGERRRLMTQLTHMNTAQAEASGSAPAGQAQPGGDLEIDTQLPSAYLESLPLLERILGLRP